ncbi:MarR family winged helix-turn-helix transcriptional regulator [Lacticaseibacillus mingshuiensis]|uniref:MarR family winged helix-turn-helix transcriptional regulator n=1 Tax=Lacticaseibacillus mingshuiensis TaxID=2799574 RepID=A0ABW4CKI7_9LACO|nr:MarR family winged helix-turn-helix transcriptional regulator [Lacticaseibacillus mingshuiensis]
MGISKAAVTKMLTPLIADQLLAKEMDTADNRSFTLSLTAKGQEELIALTPTYQAPMETVRDGLGKKRFKQLIKLLAKANLLLNQAHPNGAGPIEVDCDDDEDDDEDDV